MINQNPPSESRIREIYEVLRRLYPDARSTLLEGSTGKAMDVLIATILSQATNDTLSGRAFLALKKTYPAWEDVLSADPAGVEAILAVGGLQKEKTKKIKETLARIKADFGCMNLDRLKDWTPSQSFEYLSSLPGVGPKTAACVIGFGLCKPAFPVDTHVHRISRRLGLVPEKASAAKTQEILSKAVPLDIQMPLHVMMIRHGRTLCHARNPKCEECPLAGSCNP